MSMIRSTLEIRSKIGCYSASGCCFDPSKGLLRAHSSPSSKSVTDVASAIAMLSLAIQLHHAKTASEHLNGRSITLDGDMYLLTPIPDRDPGQLAVSVQFPDGVTVSKVFDALGYPFEHAGLEKALAIIAGANQAMSDARAKATELLEEFVAEVAQAA